MAEGGFRGPFRGAALFYQLTYGPLRFPAREGGLRPRVKASAGEPLPHRSGAADIASVPLRATVILPQGGMSGLRTRPGPLRQCCTSRAVIVIARAMASATAHRRGSETSPAPMASASAGSPTST